MRRMEYTIGSRVAGLLRPAGQLLLSAVTAVALLSCGGSGDEPGGAPMPKGEKPIAFSGNLAESHSESHARTRTTYLRDTHTTFHAWAYKNPTSGSAETVMKDYTVNYVGAQGSTISNSSGWEYVNQQPTTNDVEQSIKYWDFTASDYRFFGYAGSGVNPPTYASNIVSLSFAVSVASNPQQDPVTLPLTESTPLYSKLWYKTGSAIANDISPVQLEFLQPYVKVRFMFRQSEPKSTKFKLENIKFRPTPPTGSGTQKKIATAGTFTVTYPLSGTTKVEASEVTEETAWVADDGDPENGFTKPYYEAAADEEDGTVIAGQKMWYVVLPAKNQGTYTLSLKVNGEDKNVVVPAEYMNWQPCYEYTYIFKITENGGVEIDAVQSAFTPWKVSSKDYPIYNW